MIVDFIYLILGTIIRGIALVLAQIPFFSLDSIQSAFSFVFGYLPYIGGIINVPQLLLVLETLLTFLTLWYGYRLIMVLVNIFRPIQMRHPQH